jgi:hypothetical protein
VSAIVVPDNLEGVKLEFVQLTDVKPEAVG